MITVTLFHSGEGKQKKSLFNVGFAHSNPQQEKQMWSSITYTYFVIATTRFQVRSAFKTLRAVETQTCLSLQSILFNIILATCNKIAYILLIFCMAGWVPNTVLILPTVYFAYTCSACHIQCKGNECTITLYKTYDVVLQYICVTVAINHVRKKCK